ncbi:ribonuclease T2 [Edaphobacter sp. 12200R-103]|uniref:ribonuclease T2 family protein n=1 Tax=Edaphobacter sp. 12200R-103 TaxID=2703788 RepID=UPI00138CAAFC|nr:ribonuclease T2 [Edaphobacter sp. 12200R-103]QHS50640.1 ribonuclease T2 [Edaphobacter sp. 12200R-103]
MQKQIISLACTLVFVLLTGCNAQQPIEHPAQAPRSTADSSVAAPAPTGPQNFDYYLLNLSWSPEFCHSHPSDIQCSQHSTFVLHGLWPENNDGSYPESCSRAPGPSDPSQYSDIYPDASLLQHEWKTHGTCSGLTPDAFFHLARRAVHSVAVPQTFASLDKQISLPPAKILGLFTEANPAIPATSLAMTCGSNYLTAVEVCLDKSLRAVACSGIRSCRANTVRIPPPR